MVEAIGGAQAVGGPTAPLTAELLDAAADQLARSTTRRTAASAARRSSRRTWTCCSCCATTSAPAPRTSLEMVRHTCEAMARGGIYDQLAGGFARYSVDAHWTVPHFEKMLYDNALLLRVYTQLWRLTGDPLARRVADETAAFLLRDLGTAEGGFASALDADTDGVEGLTYAWTPAQLREVLGEEDGAVGGRPVRRDRRRARSSTARSVLRLARDIDDADAGAGAALARRAGAAAGGPGRRGRSRPATTRWSRPGTAWRSPRWPSTRIADRRPESGAPAARCGRRRACWPSVHLVDGRLRRVSRDGVVGAPAGVLEDYGCVAEAFCALHQLTGEGRWLDAGRELLDAALAHFADGDGGFYDTADDAERLVTRPADPTDNATPSGLSSLAAALVAYAALTGEPRYREAAERALATVAPMVGRHARFAGYVGAVAEALLSGPYEIAIVDRRPGGDRAGRGRLAARAARRGDRGRPARPARRAAAGRPAAAATGSPPPTSAAASSATGR